MSDRQEHDEARSRPSILDAHRAAMCGDDLSHDRKAKPRATGASVSPLVESTESLEHALASFRRNPGAVVRNREPRLTVRRSKHDVHARPGVSLRIVEEVAHDARESIGIAEHGSRADP